MTQPTEKPSRVVAHKPDRWLTITDSPFPGLTIAADPTILDPRDIRFEPSATQANAEAHAALNRLRADLREYINKLDYDQDRFYHTHRVQLTSAVIARLRRILDPA